MDLQCIKLLVTILLYLLLLILFCLFYLVDQMEDFIQGRTTITSRLEKVNFLEPPTLTLCFDPPFKLSIFEKYGVNEALFKYISLL